MEINFQDIESFFSKLNQTNYLVLRNYDDITFGWKEKLDDIDILCESREELIKLSDAKLCRNDGKCFNYYVIVDNHKLRVDIREIGDGYYDSNWQRSMLDNKVSHGMFYIMDNQDYAYSLLYHAIIQKMSFSEKYFIKIKELIGLKTKNPLVCCFKLAKFMKNRKYNLVHPIDPFVTINKKNYRILSIIYTFV